LTTLPGSLHWFAMLVYNVIVHIIFDALSQIAQSSTVDMDALGFTVFLKPEDLQSLRKFIEVVSNGIRIQ
jgi:hypothetical protein